MLYEAPWWPSGNNLHFKGKKRRKNQPAEIVSVLVEPDLQRKQIIGSVIKSVVGIYIRQLGGPATVCCTP